MTRFVKHTPPPLPKKNRAAYRQLRLKAGLRRHPGQRPIHIQKKRAHHQTGINTQKSDIAFL